MKINNCIKEPSSCYCFDSGEHPLVGMLSLRKGEVKGDIILDTNEIVFVLKGKITLALRDNPGGKLSQKQFAFLPAGDRVQYKAAANALLLTMRLTDSMSLCHNFGIEQLCKGMEGMKKPETIHVLKANARLQSFIKVLTEM